MFTDQLTLPTIEETDAPTVSYVWSPRHRRELRVTINRETRCDSRCTHARGLTCECSCGGKNHGSMIL